MDSQYFHSVTLAKELCHGCTNCIKRCPTEAIRVRNGKANIIAERCIDCGECIRVCPYHAKLAVTDPLSAIEDYKYVIALTAPTLYGQFKRMEEGLLVRPALKALGFDDVFEVAKAADIAAHFIARRIESKDIPRPVISSSCPVVVRLIQVRFPSLIDHIVDVWSPMEIAGYIAKQEAIKATGYSESDIGAFFITPCPAKMTAIRHPIERRYSSLNGAIAISDIYGPLIDKMHDMSRLMGAIEASSFGIGWANSGGESLSVGIDNALAVDGIQNVIKVLEEIEDGKMKDLDFFEGLSCPGGCVGGPLTVENGFVARNRIRKWTKELPQQRYTAPYAETCSMYFEQPILPSSAMKLDDDISVAVEKMQRIEAITADLPGLDCGSCGSPSCRALAEDIVQQRASNMDCVFKLRERVKELAKEVIELSNIMPTGKHGDQEED